jgi:hypothetical protein
MNDEHDFPAELLEEIFDGSTVADVEVVMLVIGNGFDEFPPVAQSGRFLAEKPLAEVVVDANDLEVLAGKPLDAFRADQSRRARDNDRFHKFQGWHGQEVVSRLFHHVAKSQLQHGREQMQDDSTVGGTDQLPVSHWVTPIFESRRVKIIEPGGRLG